MSSSAHALEFEVLLERAVRRGFLVVDELLETYRALQPSNHSQLTNPRKVDIEAVVRVLETVPPDILTTSTLRIVPSLAGFPHEPLGTVEDLPAGRLPDGSVLLEAWLGLPSLVNLAAILCLLRHECNKAQGLLPDELAALMHPAQTDEVFDDDDDANEAVEFADAPMATEEDGLPESADTSSHQGQSEALEAEPGGAPADDLSMMSDLAFAWGTTTLDLWQGNRSTEGGLMRVLMGEELPVELELHPDLELGSGMQKARERAERIASSLAEGGLLERPVHIWFGPPAIVDCLSPYTRDLRTTLARWLRTEPKTAGEDLADHSHALGEDLLYAAAHDFVSADTNLREERDRAERTVGIHRQQVDDIAFDLVDLARIDPNTVDTRIHDWDIPNPAPVILRIENSLPARQQGHMLESLFELIGTKIHSVTAVMEGTTLDGNVGAICLPNVVVAWAGETRTTFARSGLTPDTLQGYADAFSTGAVLFAPSARIISASHLRYMRQRYDLQAVLATGVDLIRAIEGAGWHKHMQNLQRADCVIVGSERASTGRASLPTLGGLSAVAIAVLRDLMQRPTPAVAKVPEKAPPATKGPSRRAIRIKA